MWHGEGIPLFPHLTGHNPSQSHARTSASDLGSRERSLEVLHSPHDCPHCHAYKVHAIYTFLHDDALERAWTGTDIRYEEGLGRSLQDYELSQVKTNLRRVRRERDEAIGLNARYRNEVTSLERQLREAKDRLLAIEIAYGDETHLWNTDSPREGGQDDAFLREETQDDDFEDILARSNDSQNTDIEMDELWTMENPIIQTATSPTSWNDLSDGFDIVQQVNLMSQEDEPRWEDDSSSNALQKLLQTTINSTIPVYPTDSSSDSSPSASSSLLSESDCVGSLSDDYSSPPTNPAPSNEDLRHTLELMAAAHEGNTTALAEVKKLIVHAERTPRHSRTKGQKYILLNWRSPSSSGRNTNLTLVSTQPQPIPPVYSLPPSSKGIEIFVDASAVGIGFVFKTQWLAWKFKRTSKIPLDKNGRIVMSWAELLAVEVGLRALITAGYRSTTISLRSDNTGVVEALQKKSWCQRHGIEEILVNILALCGEYGIKLKPSWVPTKENPADMPSRGLFPPWSLIFNFPPKLPTRLSELLELAAP